MEGRRVVDVVSRLEERREVGMASQRREVAVAFQERRVMGVTFRERRVADAVFQERKVMGVVFQERGVEGAPFQLGERTVVGVAVLSTPGSRQTYFSTPHLRDFLPKWTAPFPFPSQEGVLY